MGRSGIYLAIFCMFLIKSSVFREHNSSQLQNLSTVRYLCAWQFPNTLSILTNSESTVALKKADNFQEMLCKSQTFVPVSLLEISRRHSFLWMMALMIKLTVALAAVL